jgi:sulfoquinovosidase
LHGGPVLGQKFPWSFDGKAARIYRNTLRLHRAAEPYIMKLWRKAKRTGMPIARPLWLAYPRMAGAHQIDQEYLLGPNVFVAPVVTEGVKTREVVFPPGCWRDPVTGARFKGSTTKTVQAPINRPVYFFKCGTTPFTPRP